jgi:hypothetical protein
MENEDLFSIKDPVINLFTSKKMVEHIPMLRGDFLNYGWEDQFAEESTMMWVFHKYTCYEKEKPYLDFKINFVPSTNSMGVYNIPQNRQCIYLGQCRSVNDFVIIMELLGIKLT